MFLGGNFKLMCEPSRIIPIFYHLRRGHLHKEVKHEGKKQHDQLLVKGPHLSPDPKPHLLNYIIHIGLNILLYSRY